MPIRDLCSYVCSAVLGDLHLADFVHGPGCNPWSDGKVHLTPLLRGRQAEGDLHLADFVHGPGCNPWFDGKVNLTPLLLPPLETLDRLPWVQPYRRLGQQLCTLSYRLSIHSGLGHWSDFSDDIRNIDQQIIFFLVIFFL